MSNQVSELLRNTSLTVPLICWAVAQALKVFYHLTTQRKLDLRLLTSAGGMPSSHSAFVSALATAIGLREGMGSSDFAICVVFASVVMYDAAGVRRAASRQASILNRILDELFRGQPLSEERLWELIGHTPIQVVVGAIIGIVLAWLLVK
ncbi:MAG: divergent PAP2 family protein [Anaerolineae bacterium]|jgi:acid phosphatase family membrane protein YuiD|nr:divergent PAP2 family protein [Anaerolineae bacterium]MDH7474045.1 divergent PAP2 family protein [Anaerolineae bacterium]